MQNSKSKIKRPKRPLRVAISLLTGLTLSGVSLIGAADPVPKAWTSAPHVFSTDDVQSGFDGNTAAVDDSFLRSTPGAPGDLEGPPDNRGWYAIDSEFGFYVTDFVGAESKEIDGLFSEGYVSDVVDHGEAGIAVSNAKTDTFKVPYPRGTWCAGLGGVSNKCSTENYAVLEHVLTCFETLPYRYASADDIPVEDGDSPSRAPWSNTTPELAEGISCADAQLDNALFMVDGLGVSGTPLYPDEDGFPLMPANESTVLKDVAVGLKKDYAVTRKDDGKALFRFGNMVKRPNDVRIAATMALPQEWKDAWAEDTPRALKVTRAELTINHLITNNPNDQIRPEDMENEDAIGLKPRVTGDPDDPSAVLTSAVSCYEGDGDYIPLGTVLRQSQVIPFTEGSLDLASLYVTSTTTVPEPPLPAGGFPYAFSGDLRSGYTNAWATSTDRDPFQWTDGLTPAGVSAHAGNALGEVTTTTGPRWRLLPNKFGQDIPGLEIPGCGDLDPAVCDNVVPRCIPVPFTSAFIKYEVGEPATTVINLLDWEDVNENGEQDDSPLATTAGWLEASANIQNWTANDTTGTVCQDEDKFCNDTPNGVSINGAVLTDDFDVVVYVKGDRKPTELYDMTLYVEYVGDGDVVPPGPVLDAYPADLQLWPLYGSIINVRDRAFVGVTVVNDATSDLDASGNITVVGKFGEVTLYTRTWPFTLAPETSVTFSDNWKALSQPGLMEWTATVTDVAGETVTDNNEVSITYDVLPR